MKDCFINQETDFACGISAVSYSDTIVCILC
jgi:hypothetical protein